MSHLQALIDNYTIETLKQHFDPYFNATVDWIESGQSGKLNINP